MQLADFGSTGKSLVNLLAECETGQGRVAVISGAGATGKSSVLRAFGDHAVQAGAMVLTAYGSLAERSTPYGVLMQLLQATRLPPAAAERLAQIIHAPEVDDFAVVAGVWNVLHDLAKDRCLVLIVDDVQYADRRSQHALLYIQRRIEAARVMIMVTEWQHPGAEHPVFHAELTRHPACLQLWLAPLSAEEVVRRVTTELPGELSPRAVPGFTAISGGNPLILKALIEDHRAAMAADGAGELTEPIVGNALRDGVSSCLNRWRPQLRVVLHGLAVLGDWASPAALAELLDLDQPVIRRSLAALDGTGLLDSGRLRHPAIRGAVLAGLLPGAHAAMYLRAARLLRDEGADPWEIAGHLLAAGRPVTEPWVTGILRKVADHALAAGWLPRAIDCLDLALKCSSTERERIGLIAELARVRSLVNPSAVAGLIGPLRSAFDRRLLSDREAFTLTTCLLWRDAVEPAEPAMRWLDDALAADSFLDGDLDTAGAWLRYTYPPLFTPAAAAAAGVGLPAQIAAGIGPAALRDAERTLQSCSITDSIIDVVLAALSTLIHGGRLAQAAHWCAILGDRADRIGADTWTALLADVQSEICLRRGDLTAAESHARQALSTLQQRAQTAVVGSPIAHLLLATTWDGKLAEAEMLVNWPLPAGIVHTRFWPQYLRARGHYHLAMKRAYAALVDFEACGALAAEWGLDLPALLPWRGDAAQALLALNRFGEAKEIIAAERARPGGDTFAVRTAALRLDTAMTADAVVRPQLLRECADLLRTNNFTRKTQGQDLVGEQPSVTLHKTGTNGYAVSSAILSEAEQRVAVLAARGHTNREISRKLFITVSTVEQHLTKVYRKLNVNGRSDLRSKQPLVDGA
ncbi:AAA family ATPase [Nocardia sp. NPDC050175]|uniref:helix-turn-helix transcriptional regulator n=1 Tax=Nocardia sp. NPDC050175 TaxID=3364317 RepID=UPI00379247A5